jgi:protochlorophyllide reductase
MDYDEGGSANSRREVLRQATAVAGSTLASWWLWGSEPGTALAAADETAKKRICVTGCTSGIGLDAATRLAAQGHELLLAGRTTSKAQAAAARILETVPNANIGLAFECNLASLSSIQTFASQIQQLASSSSSSSSQPFVIDTLCLNAGLSRDTAAKDVARTADGFELTGRSRHVTLYCVL